MKLAAKLTGHDSAIKRLGNVSRAVRNKLLRRAANAATVPVFKAVKANAKSVSGQVSADDLVGQAFKSTGLLAKSVGRKVKVYRNSGVAVGIVGPRQGFTRTLGARVRGKHVGKPIVMDPINYSHLVEYGTRRSRAKPFIRPAWDSQKANANAAMASVLRAGIEEAAK